MTLDELYTTIERDLQENFEVNGTNTFNLLTGERKHSESLAKLSYYVTIFRREKDEGPFRLVAEDKDRIKNALISTARFVGWGSGEEQDAQAILVASGIDW